MQVGKNIRELRSTKKIKYRDFKVSHSVIGGYLQGSRVLRLNELEIIAADLDATVDDLIKGSGITIEDIQAAGESDKLKHPAPAKVTHIFVDIAVFPFGKCEGSVVHG
jgi:transcriptional regulator with XRE-family HTH domain